MELPACDQLLNNVSDDVPAVTNSHVKGWLFFAFRHQRGRGNIVERYTVQRYNRGMSPRPAQPPDQLPLTVPVFQILLSLADRDLHGYALIRDIATRTGGEVRLTASTLYGALARMLDAALIEEVGTQADTRRRCYRITGAGRALAQREAERMARATRWAHEKHLLPGTAGRTP
jgi:DNA-binding PadR family transcriptional regulator